jgi:hypothetical protein
MSSKKASAFICLLSTLALGACVGQPTDVTDDAPYDPEEGEVLQSTDDPVELGLTTQGLSADSKLALEQAEAQTTSCAGQPNFASCGTPETVFTQCVFGSTCGLTGERDELLYDFRCVNQACQTFVAFIGKRPCSRPAEETNNDPCAGNSCTEFCSSFSNQCDETGTLFRRCSSMVCSNGACNMPSGVTTTPVGRCSRETDGFDCTMECGGHTVVRSCDNGRCVCNIP